MKTLRVRNKYLEDRLKVVLEPWGEIYQGVRPEYAGNRQWCVCPDPRNEPALMLIHFAARYGTIVGQGADLVDDRRPELEVRIWSLVETRA
jgi:hypothetical protein